MSLTSVRQTMMGWLLCCWFAVPAAADEPKRLLLVGQKPDGHPARTHEYMPGVQLLAKLVSQTKGIETQVVQADDPWPKGPELINKSDAVVLFVSQGAKWIQDDDRRMDALGKLAARGGGFSVLHWGMGTREAEPITGFVNLFGACHGGPDRRYKFLTTDVHVAAKMHPVMYGVKDFRIREEFYFKLKRTSDKGLTTLLRADIEDQAEMVCWAWQRPDGGRSFGYTGMHFHANWGRENVRRLVTQGVLWTMNKSIPKDGLKVKLAEKDLQLK